jgi:hypothetical protein
MTYVYSNEREESNPRKLPNVEIFQATAEEVAGYDTEAQWDYRKRFPLASMNSGERDRMIATMIEERGITGGWMYVYGFPGCLWDGEPCGPYATYEEAFDAMREDAAS